MSLVAAKESTNVMRHILKMSAVAVAGLLLWGGCGTETSADPAFQAAVPSFDQVSMVMESNDSTPPSNELVATSSAKTGDLLADLCHPHLFVRTHEVIARLNLHTAILLNRVREVVLLHPNLRNESSHVWEGTANGVVRRFTLDKNATGLTFNFKLELATVPTSGDPTFVTVASGSATSSGATPNEETGSMTFDFSALKSVVATEQASGQFTVDFDILKGTSKKLVFHFTNFLPRGGDPHGPRTGEYVYFEKPGVGGSLKYQDSVVLLCPSNPNLLPADLNTAAEWYRAADGSVHGRADARASGGQIVTGNTWEGVTCHQGLIISPASENYWMMKVEGANGATVGGGSVSSSTDGPGACDPSFIDGNASVPSLTDNTTDFPFAASFNSDGSLKDENPFLFPKLL